jgi:hypothetical protein
LLLKNIKNLKTWYPGERDKKEMKYFFQNCIT